jgi:asparagine synthase (glutamine-hydrolysing)
MKEVELVLNGKGWSKTSAGGIQTYFQGTVHLLNGQPPISSADHLVKASGGGLGSGKLIEWLKKSTGCFSLIIDSPHETLMAVDIVRSLPIFYGHDGKRWVVSDDIMTWLKSDSPLSISENDLECFVASGIVLGNKTVIKGVQAVQAGECISLSGKGVKQVHYFKYITNDECMDVSDIASFTGDLVEVFHHVFRRLIEGAPNVRNWVVPLSGGHDSRLVADYFKRIGAENVICFSYGYAGNEEARVSRQVAERLGYPWHFVRYTPEKWNRLHQENMIADFLLYAFNGGSLPNLQDFLAVCELKEKGIVGRGDVFVPGHNLSFIADSDIYYFPSYQEMDRNEIIDVLSQKYLSFWATPDRNKHREMVAGVFDDFPYPDNRMFDYFNWHERQPSFITNGVRVYEFFGLEWRLPYWDTELVNFFLNIAVEERVNRSLIFSAERNGLLSEQLRDIPYGRKNNLRYYRNASNLGWLKNLLPNSVRAALARIVKSEVRVSEGLDQIFRMEGKSILELIEPVDLFPENVQNLFKGYLQRYPYQVNYHGLTALMTVRQFLETQRKKPGTPGSGRSA